ncbi:MAG: TonB-dependent receptor [Kofleriaceae bacterium]
MDIHAIDAATQEGLGFASVFVDGDHVGETDDQGHLTAPGLCPGERVISVDRDDYQEGQRQVTLTADRSVEVGLAKLAREVVIIEDTAPPAVDMRATTVLSGEALDRTRGKGLAEAVADVPGVTKLTSGSGLAKPIIRGQFGRRLLLLVDGIRHRSQEWGLDHAPEIDPFVADTVTVVRGAAGVQYGPDAIGGAILVEPAPLLTAPGYAGQVHLIGISNGRGGAVAGRLQGASARWPGLAAQVEGSYRRLASPWTPSYPLDNTGTDEWNLGATAGYRRGAATYKLAYLHYQARLGVCSCLRIESSEDFYAQLARPEPLGVELYRADFAIDRPYQGVGHDLALGRAAVDVHGLGTLTATYAFQYDLRREYEVVRDATTGPQFQFRLATHDLDVAFAHRLLHLTDHLHLRGSVGVAAVDQVHHYGGLPLVPDHDAVGAAVFASERLQGSAFEIEAGLRYDYLTRTASLERIDFLRLVRSGQLAMDACGGGQGDPVACASTFHTVSASLGALGQLTPAWSIKLDLSTASRPPNPDEQYLNGTAPTFPVLGLGKPDLGAETTYAATATTSYQGERLTAQASVYANRIDDYIYFAPAIGPDGRPIFDVLIRGTFPRFTTRPIDAAFWGADGGFAATPLPWLEVGAQVSAVRAHDRATGGALVFVPPDRARGSVTVRRAALGPLTDAYASVDLTAVARQDRFDPIADLAPPPPAYALVGAELGATVTVDERPLKLALAGQNLTNARYRDYTSLVRYFADQPGWQLMLRVSAQVGATPHR